MKDGILFLGDQHRINILIDQASLSDEGISDEAPITLSMKDVTLKSVLQKILKPLSLSYSFREGHLLIETKAAQDDSSFYPSTLYSLKQFPGAAEHILDTIQETVAGPWVDLDGTGGEMMVFGDSILVVRHHLHVQESIALLLHDLQKLQSDQKAVSLPQSEEKPRERETAHRKSRSHFHFNSTSSIQMKVRNRWQKSCKHLSHRIPGKKQEGRESSNLMKRHSSFSRRIRFTEALKTWLKEYQERVRKLDESQLDLYPNEFNKQLQNGNTGQGMFSTSG